MIGARIGACLAVVSVSLIGWDVYPDASYIFILGVVGVSALAGSAYGAVVEFVWRQS